jgi:hypothetical protein
MACTFHKKSALFKSAVATATLVQEVGSLLEQAAPVCKVAREPQEGWDAGREFKSPSPTILKAR